MKQLKEIFQQQQELTEAINVGQKQDSAYIKFFINDDPYITAIHSIKEILEYRVLTPYPIEISNHIGIINLRGNIIPIYNDEHSCDEHRKRIIIFEPKTNVLFGIIGTNVKRVFLPEEAINGVDFQSGGVITFENTPYRYFNAD